MQDSKKYIRSLQWMQLSCFLLLIGVFFSFNQLYGAIVLFIAAACLPTAAKYRFGMMLLSIVLGLVNLTSRAEDGFPTAFEWITERFLPHFFELLLLIVLLNALIEIAQPVQLAELAKEKQSKILTLLMIAFILLSFTMNITSDWSFGVLIVCGILKITSYFMLWRLMKKLKRALKSEQE